VGGGCLVYVLGIFLDVIEVAAPFIPGVASTIEGMVFQPFPRSVASLPVARCIALVQADQFIEQPQRGGDDTSVLLSSQDIAGLSKDPKGPGCVLVISGTHMPGEGVGTVDRCLQIF